MPPKPAKIKTGGAINIERRAWGIPSLETTTGRAATMSQVNKIKNGNDIVLIPKIIPTTNIIPTGQKSSGLPA